MAETKGRRLILFPHPLQGHLNPMLQLANTLHSHGFSITILHTTFNSPNPSSYPHLTFLSIQESQAQLEDSASDLIILVKTLNTICAASFRDCLAELVSNSDSNDEAVACLVSDAAWSFTQDVADEYKVTRVVLRTGGATSFCAFACFPLLMEKGYLPIQDSRLEEPVLELPPLKVKDLPVIETTDLEGFYKIVDSIVNGAKSSSGVIWNTFEELEESALATLQQKLQVPVFPIGPFHKHFPSSQTSDALNNESNQEKNSVLSWLDKQESKSVLYVSFGSLAAISETEFLEIAYGLSNSEQPFLWVVRPGLVRESEWLEPLSHGFIENLNEKGRIIKWADQQEVLAHHAIRAFWTHCGWNSTLESVCEGVPMICMPFFTDQKVNARYVIDVWRVGVLLDKNSNRGEIEKVIKRLLMDEEGNEIRDRAIRLKEKANLCLKESGSSYKALNGLISHIRSLESVAATS